jgi:hypothetical protein
MEYLKGKVKDLSHVQGLTKLAAFSDCCNLLKGNPGDDSSIEELKASIDIDERRRPIKRYEVSQSAVVNDLSYDLFWLDAWTLLIVLELFFYQFIYLPSLESWNYIGGDALKETSYDFLQDLY